MTPLADPTSGPDTLQTAQNTPGEELDPDTLQPAQNTPGEETCTSTKCCEQHPRPGIAGDVPQLPSTGEQQPQQE